MLSKRKGSRTLSSSSLWEIRASCLTPDGKYKVRVWQVWNSAPDSDSIDTLQDFLRECVLEYYGQWPTPEPRHLAEWLVGYRVLDTVEVTYTSEEKGVTRYSVCP